MKVKTGYLYHIKNSFFEKVKSKGLMINHENGHSRPSYLAIKDGNLLWFIPLSTKIEKYKKIVKHKQKKYGSCKTILINRIVDREQVILIQNAFPTLEKYVQSKHIVDGKEVRVSSALERKIIKSFVFMMVEKKKGNNLFFTDIDKIKEIMLNELTIGV